jgi:hypothetical protein
MISRRNHSRISSYHQVIGLLIVLVQLVINVSAFQPSPPLQILSHCQSCCCRSRSFVPCRDALLVRLQMWSNSDDIEGNDRIKSCVPYLLPLLDGDHFGIYIYDRIPPLGWLDDYLLQPLQNFYQAIPFAPILFFLALTLGTRGNMSMSRVVRFNAQQAAIIDVALVFPELIAGSMQDSDLPRALLEPCSNFVYYTYMTMVLYSVYSNLRGQKPNQIPWISEAAEMAVGPF